MSKERDQEAWDARNAFHQATMAVYSDLESLVNTVVSEPNRRMTLLLLDEIAPHHTAPEPGDPEIIANLKHAVGRLHSSIATIDAVRKNHPQIGLAFRRGPKTDHTWAGTSCRSHHEAVADAARQMLDPDSEGAARTGRKVSPGGTSGAMRRQVIQAATDPTMWARLAENLKHEYKLASLLPPREPVPEFDEPLERMEELRLKLKRPKVAKATSAKDVAALFKLWESTADILFRTNPGAVRSRPEELFHLRQIVFALAAVAHNEGHPRAAMNSLSELLNLLMPTEWFDDDAQKQSVNEAIRLAGNEIRDLHFFFHHKGGGPAEAEMPLPVSPASADNNDKSPAPSPVVLKFARVPTAKQKCLNALAAAPNGIPTHENIAAAVDLDVQTVKEAMATIRKAGHVEKTEGAWRITEKGREHLKVLRGE